MTPEVLREAASLMAQGNFEGADRLLAESDTPLTDPNVCHGLGLAYMSMEDFAAAATFFGDAIALNPNDPVFYNDFGVALYRMNRVWHAHNAFKKSMAFASDKASAEENLQQLASRVDLGESALEDAFSAFEHGDLETSRALVDRSLDELPDHPGALCLMARIAHEGMDHAKSLALIEMALAEEPGFRPALDLLDRVSAGRVAPVIALPEWRYRPPRVNEERPLVSLTIGTFNHAKYVAASVNSALAQTYSPLEIIISDDASTDETARIVEDCLGRYDGPHRTRFIRQPQNLGNRGRNNWVDVFRQTSGRFIVQFAGDDIMEPDMIEHMVSVWREQKVSLVAVNACFIDGDSKSLSRTLRDPHAAPNTSLEALARDGVNDCVFGAGMGCDREVYEVFPFSPNTPPRVLGSIDIMFPFHAGLLNGCASISDPKMQYRVHDSQTSLSLAYERTSDALEQLVVTERIWEGHLAHAFCMKETLEKLALRFPARFRAKLRALEPALANQVEIMARRQVEARYRLFYQHGIWDIAGGK